MDIWNQEVMKSVKLIIIPLLFFLLILCSACGASSSEISLQASVSFHSHKFWIQNDSSFLWYNVDIIINYEEGDLTSGYIWEKEWLSPGWLLSLSCFEFVDSFGKQYNAYREKPRILSIRAETEDGRIGTYVKEW